MGTTIFRFIAAFALSLLVAACSGPAPKTDTDSAGSAQSSLDNRVGALLTQARQAPPPERPGYVLEAAELLLSEQQPDWAYNLLQSLDPSRLPDPSYLRYVDAMSQAALSSSHYARAYDIVFAKRLDALWGQLSFDQQSALLERRAQIESLQGDYQQSLATRMQLGQYLNRDQLQLNNEAIWQDLMSLDSEDLQILAEQSDDRDLQGWAQLAQISRDNTTNLKRQLERVELWQMQWPGHPASLELPSDLQLLNQLVRQQPRKIALLLPQTGRLAGAASAVRDGFLASYFELPKEDFRPEIAQYDTASADINTVYDQAVQDGAQIVIGPLSKDNVEALAQRPFLSVPVLALNYIEERPDTQISSTAELSAPLPGQPMSEQSGAFAPQLYQFGLAPEDEARSIARYAHLQGYRRAMIIAPDVDWAERSITAFAEQWDELGGSIVADSRFIGAGDYSDVIKQALLIGQSEDRHRQLRQIIYTNSEFEPRRRKDVEVILMIANPSQARQIKPTLAFHYAGDLPVLATSQIYDGHTEGSENRDLSGIRFNTLPWFFAATGDAQAVRQHSQAPASYSRLHAMGADAFHLYARLPQLQQLPQTRLLGATGSLTLSREGRIVRDPIWAEFDDGKAVPLRARNTQL